jgi:hypothetical protein
MHTGCMALPGLLFVFMETLRELARRYPFDIIGAESARVEIEFRQAPSELAAITGEIYEFCPDMVDDGAGSVDELIKDIKAAKRIMLWWD